MTNQEFIESVSLPNEEWRDVVGFEGKYLISNQGRVISLRRKTYAGSGNYKYLSPRLMTPSIMYNGYYGVMLCNVSKKDGINHRRQHYIHRLIAEAFIPNPQNKPLIDHIDTNRTNNSISNLRWCTQTENMNNPTTMRNHPNNTKIIQLSLNNEPLKYFRSMEATRVEGFNPTCVGNCCRGVQISHKGYHWVYLSDYNAVAQ